MKKLINVTKSILSVASVQLDRYSNRTNNAISDPAKLTSSSPRARAVRCIQYSILIAIASIVAVKLHLLFNGLVDPMVGFYEVVIISNAFIPFFFALTRYKDPSALQSRNTAKSTILSVLFSRPKHAVKKGGRQAPERQLHERITSQRLMPLVSIVIPVYNEAKLLEQVVESCLLSSYPKIEIIMVDDCSTDGSGRIMDRIHEKSSADKVRVVHLPVNCGKRRAIREGLIQGNATGEICVFIDSDCLIDKYAIEKLVNAFSDKDLGAIAGHGKVLNPDHNTLTKLQDTWYDGQFSVMKGMESTFGTVTCCPGILSAYRREALLPCLDTWCNETFLGKPFDSGDDRQMTSYVIGGTKQYLDENEKRWKAKYCESAIVRTDVPATLSQFVKQQIRWKKSWIRAFLFTLPFFYKDRSPFAVASFYIQVASSFIAPLMAFRSLVLLPMEGVYFTALSYVAGVLFIDLLFAIEYKLRNADSGDRWSYRLLFSFLSIAILDWLIYYSLVTIRNNSWLTRAPSRQVMYENKVTA